MFLSPHPERKKGIIFLVYYLVILLCNDDIESPQMEHGNNYCLRTWL